jgi:hypothetical protein
LTKRVAWYYGADIWGCYENGELKSSENGPYMTFAESRLDRYLHPDESVISSLLGLKVPSFAYDDGRRENDCRKKPDTLKEVIMLPQVGARLEPHDRLDRGDLFLIDKKADLKTPFQQALQQGLSELYKNVDLYEARCRLVIQQAFKAAIGNDKPTHLILTGLGQGVWQGGKGDKTIPRFNKALMDEIKNLGDYGNLRFLTVMDYVKENERKTLGKRLGRNCRSKNLSCSYENENTSKVFDRKSVEGLVDMFSFAWDGMSLVGNEYYNGLCGNQSADPAAAYSTSVAFVSHPRINPDMYKRFTPGF